MILYHRSKVMPQYVIFLKEGILTFRWTILLLCVSKRVKSIYYLRLFNESVLMLLLYLSVYFSHNFIQLSIVYCSLTRNGHWEQLSCHSLSLSRWTFFSSSLLSFLFSSRYIPCNIFNVQAIGVPRALFQFFVIVVIQLLLGIPFLAENAAGYIGRAYEFGRVFTYKWTVNFKFLPYHVQNEWGWKVNRILVYLSLIFPLFLFRIDGHY